MSDGGLADIHAWVKRYAQQERYWDWRYIHLAETDWREYAASNMEDLIFQVTLGTDTIAMETALDDSELGKLFRVDCPLSFTFFANLSNSLSPVYYDARSRRLLEKWLLGIHIAANLHLDEEWAQDIRRTNDDSELYGSLLGQFSDQPKDIEDGLKVESKYDREHNVPHLLNRMETADGLENPTERNQYHGANEEVSSRLGEQAPESIQKDEHDQFPSREGHRNEGYHKHVHDHVPLGHLAALAPRRAGAGNERHFGVSFSNLDKDKISDKPTENLDTKLLGNDGPLTAVDLNEENDQEVLEDLDSGNQNDGENELTDVPGNARASGTMVRNGDLENDNREDELSQFVSRGGQKTGESEKSDDVGIQASGNRRAGFGSLADLSSGGTLQANSRDNLADDDIPSFRRWKGGPDDIEASPKHLARTERSQRVKEYEKTNSQKYSGKFLRSQ